MSLYDVFLPYMHNVGLSEYMKWSYLAYMKLYLLALLMSEVNDMLVVY